MAFPGSPFGPQAASGGNAFMNYVAQQGGSPLFPGYQSQGVPGGMIPGLGPLNMFTMGPIQQMFQSQGMIPGGFMGSQNLYDQYLAQQRMTVANQAISQGAQQDQPHLAQQMMGLGRMMGMPMGLQQQATVRQMAGNITPFMPLLAQLAPDLLDQMMGSRGSAAVLARGLTAGGRHAIDPFTGMRELSAASIGEMTTSFRRRLDDPNSQFRQMGVSMGQAGLMYEDMTRRGLLGVRSIGTMGREEQIRRMDEADPNTTAEELRNMGGAQMATRLRQFDANRVTRRLEDMSGAVNAMREIFGDMGNPNAPMSQIIDGLQALTQGGLMQLQPAQVENLVRQTRSIAEVSGMGVQGVMALTETARQLGGQFGLNPTLAVLAGQQGALQGRTTGDMGWAGVFGAGSPEEMAAMRTRTSTQFLASQGGNQILGFARARTQLAGGNFRQGSRAAGLWQTIQQGGTTFEGQSVASLMQNRQAMTGILQSSGLSGADIGTWRSFAQDPYGNQRYAQDHPELVAYGNQLQGQEMAQLAGAPAVRNALGQVLRGAGVGRRQRRGISRAISGEIAQNIMQNASADDRRTPAAWQAFVTRQARPALVRQLRASGMSQRQAEQQADAMMPALAGSIEVQWNRQAQRYGMPNIDQMLELHGGQSVAQQARNNAQATQDTAVRRALAPLTSRGPIRRIMDAMSQGDQPFGQVLGEALGGIRSTEVRGRVRTALQEVRRARQRLDAINQDQRYIDPSTGRMNQAGIDARAQALQSLETATTAADRHLEQAGDMYAQSDVSGDQLDAAADRTGDLERLEGDLSSGDARRQAHAERYLDRAGEQQAGATGSLINSMRGDIRSMRKLGRGGVAMVSSLEGKQAELADLVQKHGGMRKLMESGGDDAARATSLRGEISGLTTEIRRRSTSTTGPAERMTAEEEVIFKEQQQDLTRAEGDRRSDLIEKMKALGIDVGGEESREDLEKMLGSGKNLRRMEIAVRAREKLGAAAARAGVKVEDLEGMSDAELQSRAGLSRGQLTNMQGRAGGLTDIRAGETAEESMERMGRDDDWVTRQQEQEDDNDPVARSIRRGFSDLSISIATLTLNEDGSADLDLGDADDVANG